MNAEQKKEKLKSLLMEIVEKIRHANLEDIEEPIPKSDLIHRKLLADIGEPPDRILYYLRLLVDAHYLFSFKYTEANERSHAAPIYGYVIAEHNVVSLVRNKLFGEIENLYESQFYQRKGPTTIVREIMGGGDQYRNTPIGHAVNATVMMQQYENLLKELAADYTDQWRIARLNQLLDEAVEKRQAPEAAPETVSSAPPPPAATVPDEAPGDEIYTFANGEESASAPSVRATDSQYVSDIETMNRSGKWGDAVDQFGVQFLLRIHFRKYEFDKVIQLIKMRRIALEKDLRYIRDVMRTLETRMKDDIQLQGHRQRIKDLRRLAQVKLNLIWTERKKNGNGKP